jgi:hypothetical protein
MKNFSNIDLFWKSYISYIHKDNVFNISKVRNHVSFNDLKINKNYLINIKLAVSTSIKNRENIITKDTDLKKAILKEILYNDVGKPNKYIFELTDGTNVIDFLTRFDMLSWKSIAFSYEFELGKEVKTNSINFNLVNKDKNYLFNLEMNNFGNITCYKDEI